MENKLSDAEFIVMEIIWQQCEIKATKIADLAKEKTGWEKNTTYTLINRLINKGAVKRTAPNFICSPIIKKDEVISTETKTFLNKMYGGSINLFVKSFLNDQKISQSELEELKKLIDNHK
jgi:BlaI family penicillinase repressor